ncbi:MAG: SIS domain-containing protein [Chloroflexota bacterium]|nr:SIS domain-containing protein [Chloroflexota bacterium]
MDKKTPETATYQEIITQTKAWGSALQAVSNKVEAIKEVWNPTDISDVIFTGCGSTYYLSLAAASLFQGMTGRLARAIPGGELFMYPNGAYSRECCTLLVAVSRSGTTTETITAVKQFREKQRGPVIVITNYSNTPLTALGDLAIIIPEGQEQSIAQTRSFASMYVASTALAAVMSNQDDLLEAMYALPAHGEALIRTYEPMAREIGQNLDLDRYYFLGSGPRYGLACEANLKMKEMTLTHSEPFHFLEFRHGPMSMVTDTAMVVGLLSDNNRTHEIAVLDEMAALKGHILSLSESDARIEFFSGLPEHVCNVLYLPPLQLMAYYRAMAKGLNPDQPHNLKAVVELDLEIT